MNPWLLLFLSFALAWALTALVRTLASRAKLIDMPNARSSHQQPTPRGGGLAIVVSLAVVSPWLAGADPTSVRLAADVIPATLAVAAIGFVDDRWQLPAWPRAALHVIAGVWIIHHLPGLPMVEVLGVNLGAGAVGTALALLYLVWATNLFNFMDGTDGIAASQAILVSVGAAVLQGFHLGGMAWLGPVLVACCCAGFLVWNWPPARIFMGDVGSGFLGLLVGGMTLVYGLEAPALFWVWMILQGTFMVDATTTILRRFARGQRVTQAHRSHAYQHLARRVGHQPVMLAYGATIVFWLFPMAWLVVIGTLNGLMALVIAYAPLVVAACRLGAGTVESNGLPPTTSAGRP
jgi:Fuc2NAc and GlcNAc transferase